MNKLECEIKLQPHAQESLFNETLPFTCYILHEKS